MSGGSSPVSQREKYNQIKETTPFVLCVGGTRKRENKWEKWPNFLYWRRAHWQSRSRTFQRSTHKDLKKEMFYSSGEKQKRNRLWSVGCCDVSDFLLLSNIFLFAHSAFDEWNQILRIVVNIKRGAQKQPGSIRHVLFLLFFSSGNI